MALPVDVRSIEVLRQLRAQLCNFGEDARNALAATEMEITRMIDWLTHDRRMYWEGQIRRRREELSQAKSDLSRKRTSQMFGSEASLGEPRENLRETKRRLEEAEAKLERVRRWVQPLQQAIMEYRGRAQPLGDMVSSDLEHALGLLDRMIGALEEYTTSNPTSTEYVRALKEERLRGAGAEASRPAPATDEDERPDGEAPAEDQAPPPPPAGQS